MLYDSSQSGSCLQRHILIGPHSVFKIPRFMASDWKIGRSDSLGAATS